jgi:hypothetical protein
VPPVTAICFAVKASDQVPTAMMMSFTQCHSRELYPALMAPVGHNMMRPAVG